MVSSNGPVVDGLICVTPQHHHRETSGAIKQSFDVMMSTVRAPHTCAYRLAHSHGNSQDKSWRAHCRQGCFASKLQPPLVPASTDMAADSAASNSSHCGASLPLAASGACSSPAATSRRRAVGSVAGTASASSRCHQQPCSTSGSCSHHWQPAASTRSGLHCQQPRRCQRLGGRCGAREAPTSQGLQKVSKVILMFSLGSIISRNGQGIGRTLRVGLFVMQSVCECGVRTATMVNAVLSSRSFRSLTSYDSRSSHFYHDKKFVSAAVFVGGNCVEF